MTTSQDIAANKRIARKYAEVINRGDLDLLDKLCSPKYCDHTAPAGFSTGVDGAKEFLSQIQEGFPDIHLKVQELVAEHDRVVIHWTASSTHTGAFMGLAPTGRKSTVRGIEIVRIRNGLITDSWHVEDMLGMFAQLGVQPPAMDLLTA